MKLKDVYFLVFLLCFSSYGLTLEIKRDKVTLISDEEPIRKIMQSFEEKGISVLMDSNINDKKITGEWYDVSLEKLISTLAYPNDYIISWNRLSTPLGMLDQVSRITIIGDNDTLSLNTIPKHKVLDVVKNNDGIFYVRNEIIVGFKEGSNLTNLELLLSQIGGIVKEVIDPPGLYIIKIQSNMNIEQVLAKTRSIPAIDSVDMNRAFSNKGMPNISFSGASSELNLNLQSTKRVIAVFDSGIDPKYQDLPFILEPYNAIDPGSPVTDPTGHGTLVSLIASGAIVPEGVSANVDEVNVLPVCLFDENGYTSSHALFSALNYALDKGITDFNWSFGTDQPIPFFEEAINAAVERGARIYIASGNDGEEGSVFPASSPQTFSIGSGNKNGISQWSNYGDDVDAYYPGSVYFEGKRYIGTSFSSPYALYLNNPID